MVAYYVLFENAISRLVGTVIAFQVMVGQDAIYIHHNLQQSKAIFSHIRICYCFVEQLSKYLSSFSLYFVLD
ncbi:hypothetical protein HanIR_Chr04g0205511 [Helianthus annuus]|nr:hypothetical protein HanIR_Chr04g0205511 [Helianthus annuus]